MEIVGGPFTFWQNRGFLVTPSSALAVSLISSGRSAADSMNQSDRILAANYERFLGNAIHVMIMSMPVISGTHFCRLLASAQFSLCFSLD